MIVKMKKLRLLAIKSQRDELLRALQLLGCVEVAEPEGEHTEGLSRMPSRLAAFREAHRELSTALSLIDRYASAKDGLFAPRPEVGRDVLMDDSGEEEQLALAKRVIELDERTKKLSSEEMDVKNSLEALSPWLSLDIALDCTGTKSAGLTFGSIPASVELSAVKAALAESCELSELFEISSDKEQHCILVVYHRSQQEEVMAALRGFWFSQMALAGRSGTARDNAEAAKARLNAIAEEKAAIAAEIAAEKPRRDELKLAIDHMSGRIAQAEATERLLSTSSTIVLEGWVPAEAEKAIAYIRSYPGLTYEEVEA